MMTSVYGLASRFLLVLFSVVPFCLPGQVFAEAAAMSPVTLQLKWKHKFQFAGYYAAEHKGFFRDEGLDVTIVEGGPGIAPIEKVLAGHESFYGVEAGELLSERLRGKPLIAVASIYQHSPSILITLKSAEVLTPHDLAGKRIGMQIKQQNIVEIAAMFVNEGMDLSLLELSPNLSFPDALQQLQSQTLDADYGYLTSEPYLMRQIGEEAHYIRPISYGIDFYGDSLFTTEQELRKNPERVAAMRRATVKGWEYALQHPEEIIDIIMDSYSSDGYSRGFLNYEAEQTIRLMQPDIVQVGHMNPDRWNRMADIMVSLKLVDNTKYLQGFLYDPDNNGVSWLNSVVYMLAVSLLLLLLLGAGLFWLVRRLNQNVERKTETLHKEVELRAIAEQKLNHYSEVLEERLVFRSNELTEKNRMLGLMEKQLDVVNKENSRLLNRVNDNIQSALLVLREVMFHLRHRKQDKRYVCWEERLAEASMALQKIMPVESSVVRSGLKRQALLVEDNELNQLVASELLQTIGIRVTVVDDGHQALDILEKQLFDLVFMDISMPGIDGYETTRRIRARGDNTVIIALTAHALADDRKRCLDAGMNDYLSKPFELENLQEVAERWLDAKVVAMPVVHVEK